MPGRFGHYEHVVRMASLFAIGFAAFVVVRAILIPNDFGVLGFYRAGAIEDAKMVAPKYAGQAVCVECHSDVGELRSAGAHVKVSCEACHGPLASHVADFQVKPRALDPRTLCLQCHTAAAGKPRDFPQIVPADHFEGACKDCHTPHKPGLQ